MSRNASPPPAARRPAGEAARDPRAATGYPSGARTTPVPDLLFSRDLTAIDNPLALRVLLWLLWQVHRRPAGAPPAVRTGDVTADLGLRRAATAVGAGSDASTETHASNGSYGSNPSNRSTGSHAIALALDAACRELTARGLVLDGGGWLVINDRAGREVFDAAAADPNRWPDLARAAADVTTDATSAAGAGEDDPAARATIYALYEQTIGMITPVLADELAEAAAEYPPAWIARAFRLAAANGARKWSYVRAILTRWERDGYEGEDDEVTGRRAEATRRPDSEGPYAAWIKH
ncbi:MAG: DnaD domain protein [Ardenticatenales bacterium]